VPKEAIAEVTDTLSGRWIGQGPKVDRFEKLFEEKFLGDYKALAVGSGTDALHLAYLLVGVEAGDEVIAPVFTCTATNIPLLYIGAKVVFADIDPDTMNISVEDVRRRITPKTKAVVCVDYGGVPCDYDGLQALCDQHGLHLLPMRPTPLVRPTRGATAVPWPTSPFSPSRPLRRSPWAMAVCW
jgi:dTDP-4-amino-4,6-dideoxygalactose transaminase